MSDPAIRRRFQNTDLGGNHNKFWMAEWWEDGTAVFTWGRVGTAGQSTTKHMREWEVLNLIDQKLRKGYEEVDLHVPVVITTGAVTQATDPKVHNLLEWLFQEAGEHIKTYLASSVDALSQAQIDKARNLLRVMRSTPDHIEAYYRLVPTKLPARIDPADVVRQFNPSEQEERLNQLEAALAGYTIQQAGGASYLSMLGGTQVEPLPQSDNRYAQLADYILRTSGGGYRLKELFTVCIPNERTAFEQETRGKTNVRALFHGTYAHNVRHILRSGLIVPRSAANGRRMGNGIYFADHAKRSLSYTGSNRGRLRVLFVNDVALGNPKQLDGEHSNLNQAPAGYDSVWGIKSYSGLDEFIVYRTSQQTIRVLATLE